MLKYRALLVDTEGDYRRPCQTFCNDIRQVEDWAKMFLCHAGVNAHVQVYAVDEREVGVFKRSDFYDQGPAPGIQPADKKTGEPAQ
jgi:hypothetical protein